MAKLAILSSFGQIADHFRAQELKITIEVFHMVFVTVYQDHFFKFKTFYFSLYRIVVIVNCSLVEPRSEGQGRDVHIVTYSHFVVL